MGDWRLAHALEKLRAQVNLARPNRSKSSDGSIGDANHASRTSDHNPWVMDGAMGVVTAIDITHDPKGGFDSYKFAEILRDKKDKRIKYVISNKKIFSSSSSPWTWKTYTGSNPHDHHVHVSVLPTKNLYDDTSEWNTGDMFGGEVPGPSGTPEHPILRRGDKGPAVVELQNKLKTVKADGYFGPNTEAAVTHFQESRKLVADGIVGEYTWIELERPDAAGPVNNPKFTDIIATMFGGSADPNKSAYDGHPITDTELGVALPYRFPGTRPQVRVTNRANGKSSVCAIVDVGPWNTTDNYWAYPKGRPQAESGRDLQGRTTNMAGIDVTPAVNTAIGLGGLGRVDWEFVTATAPEETPDALQSLVAEIAKQSDAIADSTEQLSKATAALNSMLGDKS